MFDATEIARLREINEGLPGLGRPDAQRSRLAVGEVRSLLDALEQAQKERDKTRDKLRRAGDECDQWQVDATELQRERDAAQKDAKDARALAYEECAAWLDDADNVACRALAGGLRARIEAMLEKKI